MVPARVVKVSGTVITSDGQPASHGFLMLQIGNGDDFGFSMNGGGMVQPDGTFTLSGHRAGRLRAPHESREFGRATSESGSLPITVHGEEDLTGLTLTTSRATEVTGQLTFDGAAAGQGQALASSSSS